jgi:hypothetical protein
MSNNLYVATDAKGIEHAPEGQIAWVVPTEDAPTDLHPGHPVTLRQTKSLLDFLDERIFLVDSDEEKRISEEGTVEVRSAHVVAEATWNPEIATRFALDCAEYLLDEFGDASLPDGQSLKSILSDARGVLGGISDATGNLRYLARVRALRRLKHDRQDVGDYSFTETLEDEMKDVDALNDPEYETLAPITDAVLAAVEALRHHVLPHLYVTLEDREQERLEHAVQDRTTVAPIPTAVVTLAGEVEAGAPHLLHYEPAWTCAREAARHARGAARVRQGEAGERSARNWQAQRLETLLSPAGSRSVLKNQDDAR